MDNFSLINTTCIIMGFKSVMMNQTHVLKSVIGLQACFKEQKSIKYPTAKKF